MAAVCPFVVWDLREAAEGTGRGWGDEHAEGDVSRRSPHRVHVPAPSNKYQDPVSGHFRIVW